MWHNVPKKWHDALKDIFEIIGADIDNITTNVYEDLEYYFGQNLIATLWQTIQETPKIYALEKLIALLFLEILDVYKNNSDLFPDYTDEYLNAVQNVIAYNLHTDADHQDYAQQLLYYLINMLSSVDRNVRISDMRALGNIETIGDIGTNTTLEQQPPPRVGHTTLALSAIPANLIETVTQMITSMLPPGAAIHSFVIQ